MNVYFRTDNGLVRVFIRETDPGMAQVQAYLIACEQRVLPTSAVLAVISGRVEAS